MVGGKLEIHWCGKEIAFYCWVLLYKMFLLIFGMIMTCVSSCEEKMYVTHHQGWIQDFFIGGSNLQRGVGFVNFT